MATLNLKGFPDPLYRKLQRRAVAHHGSLTQEVTAILLDAVQAPAPLSITDRRLPQLPALRVLQLNHYLSDAS